MKSVRLALGFALAATLALYASPAQAAGSVSAFQQCENRNEPAPYESCNWINGGLNAQNHYAEDDVLPQRVVFDATDTGTNTLTVTYDDLKNGSVHGFDYLATWNLTQTAADRCLGLTGAAASVCAGPAATAPMASDGAVRGGGVVSDHELPSSDRRWTIYGGTITNVAAITHTSSQGVASISFQAAAPGPVVILFGGHIAVGSAADVPRSWGAGNGAHSFPGGSLGMNVGGATNSINTGAIAALSPASFTVTKTADTSTAAAGDTVGYDVVVTNTGGQAGTTSFTDDYADTATVGALPSGCADSTDRGNRKFTCTTGSIAAGASQTFSYDLTMPASFTGTPSGCANGGYPVANSISGAAGSATATVCVTASPKFTVVKTAGSSTAGAGDVVSYTVKVGNVGSAPGSTSFTDDYDDRATVGTLPNGCTDATTGTDKKFSCATGSIAAGASQTFSYDLTMPASFTGTPSGCANGGYPVANSVGGAAGSGQATVCVTATPRFSVEKTASTDTADAGDTVGYTVVVTNNGSGAGSTSFTDDYPDDATVGTLPAGCTDATQGGDKRFTCTTGSIDPGQVQTFHYDLTLPAAFTGTPSGCANGGYPVTNNVAVANGGGSDAATVCVTAAPEFAVTKTAATTTAGAGDTIGYSVKVTNTGSAPGSATFTDDYDDDATVATLPAGCVDASAGGDKKFTCTTASLDPGKSATVSYDLKLPTAFTGTSGGGGCATGTYPVGNAVTLGDDTAASSTVCVAAAPKLALVKSAELHSTGSGDQLITYTLTWSNTGSAEAQNVQIADPVPSGTTFDSCEGDCGLDTGPVTWTVGTAAPGDHGSVQLVVKVTSNQVCSVTNTATIGSGSTTPVSSNTVSTNVVPVPDPTGANASGAGRGVKLVTAGLVTLLLNGGGGDAIGYASSSQTGPGGPVSDHDGVLSAKIGSLASVGAVTTTSTSAVTPAPMAARQVSTSEIAKVCLVPVAGVCTVETNTLRAVASTMANGTTASVSAAGSTIQNLKIAGLGVPVDLNQTTKVTLNPLVFGPGSYVAINEKTGKTGLTNGKLTADMSVTMIHLKITGLLKLQAVEIVVGQATAHSEFKKSVDCNPNGNTVSGHAVVAALGTGPLQTNVIQGFVQISPKGGADEQHVVRVTLPADGSIVNAKIADSSSAGTVGATGASSRSVAEIAGDGTGPLCLLRTGGGCVIEATAIRSEASSKADGVNGSVSTDAGTTLVNLKVLGVPVAVSVPPNTMINLPGIGFVVLNEQTCDGGGTANHQCSGYPHSGITVRAVHVVVNVLGNVLGLQPGVELVVAEAHADTTFR